MAKKPTTKRPTQRKPPRAQRAVLDLDTTFARRHVNIDGQGYEIRDAAEFSVLENHRQGRLAKRIGELQEKPAGELTDDEVVEIVAMLDDLTSQILQAPDEVRAKLSDVHKLQVVGVFTQLLAGQPATPAAAEAPAEPSETPAAPSTGGR